MKPFRFIHIPVIAVALTVALPPSSARAATFTFDVQINRTVVVGTGPASSTVVVSLFSADGTLADRVYPTSTSSGHWSALMADPVIVGSKIRAAVGGQSRLITVPPLSIKVNRVTDLVSGRAPANTQLSIEVGHNETLDSFAQTNHFTKVTSNDDGAWSRDVTTLVNVEGSDGAAVILSTSAGDEFSLGTDVPYMSLRRASSVVEGQLNNASSSTIKLRRADGTLRATASLAWSSESNILFGSFVNSSGDLVDANAGNKVVGSFNSDASFIVPAIVVAGDASTDQVTGHCMTNRKYRLTVGPSTAYGTTNGSGNLSHTIAGLDLGDKLTLTCRFGTGDRVQTGGVVVP